MITNETGFRLALEQLKQAYETIASIRAQHPDASPEWIAVMAEGFIDHALQLRKEIEEYTGVAAFEEQRAAR